MIVEFSVFDTKDFSIEHLFDSEINANLIEDFEAGNTGKWAFLDCRVSKSNLCSSTSNPNTMRGACLCIKRSDDFFLQYTKKSPCRI
ncbi:MAG: hypothetical protein II811_09660 [Spirochaetaceae bacterium]|nr:hypothetical protein [Spirochaetaceae bacterium]